jgi:hypothetical protein
LLKNEFVKTFSKPVAENGFGRAADELQKVFFVSQRTVRT